MQLSSLGFRFPARLIKAEWTQTIAVVAVSILIRNLLEMYLKNPGGWVLSSADDLVNWWVHFPLFYVTVWLGGALGLALLLETSFSRTARLAAYGVPIIIIGPLVDCLSVGGGIPYLYVKSPEAARAALLNLLNPASDLLTFGIPPGPRVEVGIAVVAALFVTWSVAHGSPSGRLLTSLAASAGLYLWIYILCCWPALLNALRSEQAFAGFAPTSYASVYAVTSAGILGIAHSMAGAQNIGVLIRFLRPKRLIHYLLLTLLGFVIQTKENPLVALSPTDSMMHIVKALAGLAALVLVFISTTILNDFTDGVEDRHNNRSFVGDHPELHSQLFTLVWLSFGVALVLAFTVSLWAMSTVFIWFALNVAYSYPPVRLKRWAVTSHMTIAIASSLALYYGASLAAQSAGGVSLPPRFGQAVFLLSFLGAFMKDLPDETGDRLSGIGTLPAELSPVKHKMLYAVLMSACYIVPAVMFFDVTPYVWLLGVPLVISLYFIVKRPNENTGVLALYYTSLAAFIVAHVMLA